MLALVSSLAAIHLVASPIQPVDFQVMTNTQAKPHAMSAPSVPPASPEDFARVEPQQAPLHPRYSMAHGFGNDIPLAFAAKQIVPSSIRVVFRSGVDPETRVSWKGERPWTQSLGTALTQHGLHMVLIGRTLTIGY